MPLVQIQLQGAGRIEEARKRFENRRQAWQAAPRRLVHDAAIVLRRALKDAAPKRSGKLADSIGFRTVAVAAGVAARFFAESYAKFVIEGTEPHEITAGILSGRSGTKALAFEIGGTTIFRQKVWHPGTQANDFRKRALEAVNGEVRSILQAEGHSILLGDTIGSEVSV